MKTASWVIRRKSDGAIMFETFRPLPINTAKYIAIPIDWHLPSLNRGSNPAYFVGEGDLITVGDVPMADGWPCNNLGEPLREDAETRCIVGYADSLCRSFEDGKVLIPYPGDSYA